MIRLSVTLLILLRYVCSLEANDRPVINRQQIEVKTWWSEKQKTITPRLYQNKMQGEERKRSFYSAKNQGRPSGLSVNNIDKLLADCDGYTKTGSFNSSLKCTDGLLARSGADYLRQFLPPTNDKPGYAKLRILDSFTLTNGKNACKFTETMDGRHFYPLDLLKIQAIAEGVLEVFENSEQEEKNSERDILQTPSYQYLVSHERAKKLAESRSIRSDFHELLQKAFKNRFLAFIGDSTTCCIRNTLVAYLKTMNSKNEKDMMIQKLLDSDHIVKSGGIKSEEMFNLLKKDCPPGKKLQPPYFGGRCAYVGKTSCTGGALGCNPAVIIEDIAVSVSDSAHQKNKGALGALHPSGDFALQEVVRLEKDYVMDDHANKLPSIKPPSRSLAMELSLEYGNTSEYLYPHLRRKLLKRQHPTTSTTKEGYRVIKSTTLVFPHTEKTEDTHDIEPKEEETVGQRLGASEDKVRPTEQHQVAKAVEDLTRQQQQQQINNDGIEREKKQDENKFDIKKPRTIVFVHGAFHYFHFYPALGFDALNGLNLGHYHENMISLLDTLRKHLGPDHLVIWGTVGNVCDEKFTGTYGLILKNIKQAISKKHR